VRDGKALYKERKLSSRDVFELFKYDERQLLLAKIVIQLWLVLWFRLLLLLLSWVKKSLEEDRRSIIGGYKRLRSKTDKSPDGKT
jgi:hypothetical protein